MRTILLAAFALAGCTTTFYGSSRVNNGVAGCKAACDGWGMDLAGMVKMGEYSDGCICQVKPVLAPNPAAPGEPAGQPHASGGSIIPPATGVYLQMQAQAHQAAAAGAAAQQGAADRARASTPTPRHR